ncbi:rRNA maturation RNase YbeY [Parasutterella excrementihominis]|uniref:rRNA maturation RNase YbeY n=1 Tax=Parasutterella excrementihominis TaxID=487175 RepID=UPI002667190D|nr:rRNA maturation RNase YbeY [Parasutterella excrementihominis]
MRNPHVLSLSVQNLAHFPQLPSRSKIQRWISRALENDAQITVRFVEEEEGRELNKTYRGKDYATNVLTFDYQVEPVVEADLVICVPVLEKESKDQNKTLEEHMAHLLVHGTLHAQGYDHMNDEEAEVMEQRENDVLVDLGFDVPYPDRNYTPQPLA